MLLTAAVPFDAAVTRPAASTVILGITYDPGVTAVLTKSTVTDVPTVDTFTRPEVPLALLRRPLARS